MTEDEELKTLFRRGLREIKQYSSTNAGFLCVNIEIL